MENLRKVPCTVRIYVPFPEEQGAAYFMGEKTWLEKLCFLFDLDYNTHGKF
jgi:hypothetical protein